MTRFSGTTHPHYKTRASRFPAVNSIGLARVPRKKV